MNDEMEPTIRLFARKALGAERREEYVSWALEMLEFGHDSRNLRILAGLMPPLSASEVESHFLKALAELEISPPNALVAVDRYACSIAKDTLDGTITPYECAAQLDEICHRLGYPPAYVRWVELSEIGGDLQVERLPRWLATMSPKKFHNEVIKEARAFIKEVGDA